MILGFRYSSVQKAITVQSVVVAGGGGGGISTGGSPGGGGGAGGYRSSAIGEGSGREAYNSNLSAELPLSILSGVSIPVSVGAGGPNTTIGVNSVFSSITSTGGGRGGGGGGQAGGNGGSGGGAGSNTGANGGTGTTGQGWDGNAAGNAYGGGGGGAGSSSPGGVSSYTKGGRGRQTLITGSTLSLAGGGCGGAPDALGGAGGGSNNVFDTVNPPGGYTPPSGTSIFYGGGTSGYSGAIPAAGTANTGGGGGGGNSSRPENGAAGGSGIILLKYPATHTITIGAGLTGSTGAAVSGFKTTTITAGAGNVSWEVNPPEGLPFNLNFLLIAGGSGGFRGVVNQFDGGGGDAGGYRTSTGGLGYRGAAAESGLTLLADASYTATVGAGGPSSTVGSNSVFSTITSTGGPATGGNNGGYYGGQGSGSGPISTFTGGAGTANTITGSSVTRAGGGGSSHTGSYPGSAGGGTGNSGGTGGPATANTGSGGGGGRQAEGGNGGSGILVVTYPDTHTITIGAGLTGLTDPSSGGFKRTTFTAGTGNVSWTTTPSPITTIGQALNTFIGRVGLIGQYFGGDWRSTISTGNIGTLPLSSPTTYTSIAYGSQGDYYGFIAIGYFKPPTTGTYTFYTSSDDGSGVWIGDIAAAASGRTTGNAVLDNLMGGGQGDTKRSGSTTLTGGTWYPIRIVMEEGGGGDNLTFSWAGPGIGETTSLSTYFKAPMDLSGNVLNTYFA